MQCFVNQCKTLHYLNEEHWALLKEIWFNASGVGFVLQVFQINVVANCVNFPTCSDEMGVVSWRGI